MSEEIAIKVENVSKNFKLPHEKHSSLKSKIVHSFSKTKGFQTQHALKDVSFEVKKGEFFGIVGRNGSGKSTLLKMLAGIYQPSQGKISVQGKLVPFIELGVGFNPELTGRENVFLNGALLGFTNTEVAKMYDEIVEFAELERFMDQKLKNYSSGMQVRLAFSMAVRANADVLLIDEVLAVGDADFQRKCFSYFKRLKKQNKTVIFVSHDMGAIREFCDRAMLIDDTVVFSIGTSTSIAREYSKLFIDKTPKKPVAENESVSTEDRWGDNRAMLKDVKVVVSSTSIAVSAVFNANESISKIVYGIHVKSEDGVELFAVNNRMVGASDLKQVSSGDIIKIDWEFTNVLSDGNFSIDLTLVDASSLTIDWVVGAAKFTVKRDERSTTAILPPVNVKTRVLNKEQQS